MQEPWVFVVSSQRRKPHLPIEARLIRSHPPWTPHHIACLVFEFIFLPLHAIIRGFEHDLRTRSGHVGKKSIAVCNGKWTKEDADLHQRLGSKSQQTFRKTNQAQAKYQPCHRYGYHSAHTMRTSLKAALQFFYPATQSAPRNIA